MQEYFSYFNEYYQLLLMRYERLNELRENNEWSLDAETYLDMIIVQLRALLCEKKVSQEFPFKYTIQQVLSMDVDDARLNAINALMETVMVSGEGKYEDWTVRDVIKIVADKTICHYDTYHDRKNPQWELQQWLKDLFIDKSKEINLDYIMNTIKGVLYNGVQM